MDIIFIALSALAGVLIGGPIGLFLGIGLFMVVRSFLGPGNVREE